MHPILFQYGSFELYTYGFFIAVAILSAILWPAWIAKHATDPHGMKEEVILDMGLLVLVGAVLGSRLEYVRTHWTDFAETPKRILDLREGGFVFYGGLALSVVLCLIYLRIKKVRVAPYADVAGAAIALGQGIGRLGCFFAGCCYGKNCDLPWAVTFPAGGLAPAGVKLHPTQLYESAVMFTLVFLLARHRTRVRFPGENIFLYGMAYGVWRSINELFRGDPERGWAITGVLTNGQATSILIATGCAIAWVVGRRRAASTVDSQPN